MKEQTFKHLSLWIDETIHEDEKMSVLADMLYFLSDYPDLPEKGRSWREIRELAARYRNRS